MKRTHDDFINIILKPAFYITDEELKWVLKRKESKPFHNVLKGELKKREERKLAFA